MKNFIVLLLLIGESMSYSQVAISKNNATPDTSAILDLQSTDSGLLIPRMTISERNAISNPATGLLVYSTDDNIFYYYDGSSWVKASGDDLGDHKAKQNLEMQGHWISYNGNDKGIYINDQGNIGVGTNNLYVNNQNKTKQLLCMF